MTEFNPPISKRETEESIEIQEGEFKIFLN